MNFEEAYSIWSSGDEAPEIYHRWAGISIVSNLVSRRVWCEQGLDVVMTNLFVMFVGPAGNGKSTAMKKARDIIRKYSKFCPIPPRAQTHQSLIQDLADDKMDYKKAFDWNGKPIPYSHASLFCNEFITLLGADPLGIVGFLTDIYDDDSYEYKIKNPPAGGNKLDHIMNPYITLLGCMTPEKTSGVIKEGIVSTGFSRRCIFVYATRSSKAIPRRTITPEQFGALAVLEKWAQRLVHLTGKFTWSKDAEVYFDAWYFKNKKLLLTVNDSFFASWLNSKDQIVVKIAMLLTLANEDQFDFILKPDMIKKAIELIDETEQHFPRIFSGAGRNPIAAIAAKMHAIISDAKEPLNLKKLKYLMRDHGRNEELDEALDNLREDGQLVQSNQVIQKTVVQLVGTPEIMKHLQGSDSSIELPKT
jgi:hypothetical protein